MKKYKCLKCGHQWQARVEEPVACPRCKRYDWKNAPRETTGEKKREELEK